MPFGFGLSYTTFEYSLPKLSSSKMKSNETVQLSVTVKNTGKVAGQEVVQMYIRDMVAQISRPLKELKGFKKINLQPGESREVTFDIDVDLLKYYTENMEHRADPGEFHIMVGPNSMDLKSEILIME